MLSLFFMDSSAFSPFPETSFLSRREIVVQFDETRGCQLQLRSGMTEKQRKQSRSHDDDERRWNDLPDAAFLVLQGSSSFPARHEVSNCLSIYLVHSWERAFT